MLVLIGPIWFFSDIGGFIGTNPVLEGKISVEFFINKTLTETEFENTVGGDSDTLRNVSFIGLDNLYTEESTMQTQLLEAN